MQQLAFRFFLGDAPEIPDDDDVFKTWDEESQTYINIPDLTLYYIEGKEGWTSPTWNGYPTATWEQPTRTEYPVVGGNIYFDKETGAITDCDDTVTRANIPAEIEGVAVTSIDVNAFYRCSGLTSVTIPQSVTSIGMAAFLDCSSLTSVTIPDSVTYIGYSAFDNTQYFNDASNWINGVLYIGNHLIRADSTISGAYTIKEGTKTIAHAAFRGCTDLTRITISDSVTNINIAAFSGCTGLTSIAIPDSVTSIGNNAFGDCTGLTNVDIGNSVTSIDDGAFSNCSGLTSITIPDSVTKIGTIAFYGCAGLTKVNIGNSLQSIGIGAFGSCTSLINFSVDSGNECYSSSDGILYNKEKTTLILYPQGRSGSYTVSSGVEIIGYGAFGYCTGLTSITFAASVTSIEGYAFEGCTSLNSAYFMGHAPKLGEHVFELIDYEQEVYSNIPGLTLYYIEGKEGWTSPTWNGYPTATWTPDQNPAAVFTDVAAGKWYYDAVNFAVENGLFNGTSDTTFSPNDPMTRAMLVTVLWRLDGEPASGGANPFADVPAGKYYTNAVVWAAENGIVTGADATHFNPKGNVTREQMAAILFRYAAAKDYSITEQADLSAFPDAGKVSNYAKNALAWANAEGLITGDKQASGTVLLNPKGNATRAQVAVIFMRFAQGVAGK